MPLDPELLQAQAEIKELRDRLANVEAYFSQAVSGYVQPLIPIWSGKGQPHSYIGRVLNTERLDLLVNLLYSGTTWVLEDTTKAGIRLAFKADDTNVLRIARGPAAVPYVETAILELQSSGSFVLTGTWQGPFVLNSNYLWVDGSGKLRIKATTPTSDTDGTVVGTQT